MSTGNTLHSPWHYRDMVFAVICARIQSISRVLALCDWVCV